MYSLFIAVVLVGLDKSDFVLVGQPVALIKSDFIKVVGEDQEPKEYIPSALGSVPKTYIPPTQKTTKPTVSKSLQPYVAPQYYTPRPIHVSKSLQPYVAPQYYTPRPIQRYYSLPQYPPQPVPQYYLRQPSFGTQFNCPGGQCPQ